MVLARVARQPSLNLYVGPHTPSTDPRLGDGWGTFSNDDRGYSELPAGRHERRQEHLGPTRKAYHPQFNQLRSSDVVLLYATRYQREKRLDRTPQFGIYSFV